MGNKQTKRNCSPYIKWTIYIRSDQIRSVAQSCPSIYILESPLDCKEIKLATLKEINSEYSLEELMLTLKLQYFGHLMRTASSLEKTLRLGKIEGKRKRGQQRIRWLDSTTNSMDNGTWANSRKWRGTGSLACCGPWGCKESDTT